MNFFVSIALVILLSLTIGFTYGQSHFFNYTSPIPGSEYINPEQTIILKTGLSFDSQSVDNCRISIKGSESGPNNFTWKFSEDFKTLVIIPKNNFFYGETIVVNVSKGLKTFDGTDISDIYFSFKIKTHDNLQYLKDFYKREMLNEKFIAVDNHQKEFSNVLNRDNSLPLDYPPAEMIHFKETDDNYLFFTLNPRAGAPEYNNYITITDKFGVPLFFRKMSNNCLNFHVMHDGRLAYARNNYGNPENEKYYFMDSSYVVIDSVKTGNGYNMDAHDMLLLENGHYLLMSYMIHNPLT